jgi:hypothetical protein
MIAVAASPWVLPVSGRQVPLRLPTGQDELLLLESRGPEVGRAISLADRLAGETLNAAALPVPDLDALLLRLRQLLISDRILSEADCPTPACGTRVDIGFSIHAYLAHHVPRSPPLRVWRVTECSDAPGWFALHRQADPQDAVARFRLPTAGDELDAAIHSDGAARLASRCLQPAAMPAKVRRAAETAMAAMAPSLEDELAGTCPECGATVTTRFDPRRYVLSELRARAMTIAEELDVLATRYHWSERAILALPSERRFGYAELARRTA